MTKQVKERDPYKLTALKQIGWSGRAVSLAANVIVLSYITFFCTNILGMDPILVGTILLVTKIFDGVTDLFAGVLIDRTHTKMGKARPYEFAILGVWISTVLLFSCPDMGTVGKAIWVAVTYTFINSIFATLLNASEAVYLRRGFKYENDRNTLISVNGLLVTLVATAVSIAFPIMMGTLGTTKGGWKVMILITAIPLAIIGMGRFLFVKEVNVDDDESNAEILHLKDIPPVLKNRYIWILFVITFIANLITNTNSAVGTYYFTYIVGDVTKMSLVGALGLISPFALLLMPLLLKKVSLRKVFIFSFIMGILGSVVKGFAGANMVLIMVGSILLTFASLPPAYFGLILVIDVMEYHEWKTGNRVEGVISSVNGFASKIGSGVASAAVGLIMGLAGFDGTAEVISSSATNAIVALFCWIPAALYAVSIILMKLFDLEEKLPAIKQELAERHAQQ